MDNIPHSWSVGCYPNDEAGGVDVRRLCTDGRKIATTLNREEAIRFAVRLLLSALEAKRSPMSRDGLE